MEESKRMKVPEFTRLPCAGSNLYEYKIAMLGHTVVCYMPNLHYKIELAQLKRGVRCHSHQLSSLLEQSEILPPSYDVDETCAQLQAAFLEQFQERCPMTVRQTSADDVRTEYYVKLTEDGIISVTFSPPDNRPVYAEGDLMFELITPAREMVQGVYTHTRTGCLYRGDNVPALSVLMETYHLDGLHRSFYPVQTVWSRNTRLENSHLVFVNTWDSNGVQVFFEVTQRVFKMRGNASDGTMIRIDSDTAEGLLDKAKLRNPFPFFAYCDCKASSEMLELMVQVSMEKFDVDAVNAAFDGKYGRVKGIMGQGSYGVVYQTMTAGREVYAIKVERDSNLYRFPGRSEDETPVPHYVLSDDRSTTSTVTLSSGMEVVSGSTQRRHPPAVSSSPSPEPTQLTTNEVYVLSKLKGARHILQLLDHRIVPAASPVDESPSKRAKVDPSSSAPVDLCYMVTECYSKDLHDYLELQGPRNGFPVRRVIECLLNGLEEMESRSVAHLDIKAANILVKLNPITRELEDLVYADFGMGKVMGPNGQRELTSGPYCTWQGRPPELYSVAGFATCRTDAFSVACLLYFVVTGRDLFCDGLEEVIEFNIPENEKMQKRRKHFKNQLSVFMVEDEALEDFFNLWVAMLSYHERDRPSSATVARVFRERCTFQDEFAAEYVWPVEKDCDPVIKVKLRQGSHWDIPFEYSFMERLLREKSMVRALRMVKNSIRYGRLVHWGHNS